MKKLLLPIMALFFVTSLGYAAMSFTSNQPAQAYNNGANVAKKASIVFKSDYAWRWNGPYYATPLTGTAGGTVIKPLTIDTNLSSAYYQGPLKVVFVCTAGTVYWAPQSVTYSPNSLTQSAATATGMPAAANTPTDTGVLWPGQTLSFQQLDTVTRTANAVVYWVLDQDW